jgi:DNA-directed RNA polymerase subunit H (RpoH/RPB5)
MTKRMNPTLLPVVGSFAFLGQTYSVYTKVYIYIVGLVFRNCQMYAQVFKQNLYFFVAPNKQQAIFHLPTPLLVNSHNKPTKTAKKMNNMNPNDLVNLKTRTLALQKEQLRRIAENDPNAQVYEYEEGEAPTDLMPAQRVAELLRIAREESIRIRNDRSLQKWDDFHTQLELQARLEGDKADEEEKKLKIMSMYESLKRYVLYFHPDWKNEEEKIHAEIGLLSARAVDAYLQTMNEIVAEQIRDGSGNNGGEGDQG